MPVVGGLHCLLAEPRSLGSGRRERGKMSTPDRLAHRNRPAASAAPAPPARSRRADLDALRIVLCGGIILFHTLSIWSAEPIYHLKSALPSPAASVLAEFLRIAIMPFFFVLAGWSAVASLRRRDAGGFVRERVRRLLVPLVAGPLLLGSLITYRRLVPDHVLTLYSLRVDAPTHCVYCHPSRSTARVLSCSSGLCFASPLFSISFPSCCCRRRCASRGQTRAPRCRRRRSSISRRSHSRRCSLPSTATGRSCRTS